MPTSSTRTCWRSCVPDIALQWLSNTIPPPPPLGRPTRPGRRLLRSGAGNGVMVDPALTGRHRRAQRPCTLRHLQVSNSARMRWAIAMCGASEVRRVRSSRRRKAAAAATSAIPVSARLAARAVQASKVANSVSPGRQGVGRIQRHQHGGIEVKAQRPALSRSRLSSAPASSATGAWPERRPASQSRSSGVILRAGYATGRSSTTGLPCRVITTPSPRSARSISSDRRFLASTTACALISKI
jgi:hypothetical protein